MPTGGTRLLIWVGLAALHTEAIAQVEGVSASHAPDRPVAVRVDDSLRLEAAIAPFRAMSLQTYPSAKQRFLSGLPLGAAFYVAVNVADSAGQQEQVFVLVMSIRDGQINGTISSAVLMVAGYKRGDAISFDERELRDWAIVDLDGNENGNFVGKLLDQYRPGMPFVAVFSVTLGQSGQAREVSLELVTDSEGEPLNLSLPTTWVAAASEAVKAKRWMSTGSGQPTEPERFFVPVLYDPDRPDAILFAE
jgi:hypothetical protein